MNLRENADAHPGKPPHNTGDITRRTRRRHTLLSRQGRRRIDVDAPEVDALAPHQHPHALALPERRLRLQGDFRRALVVISHLDAGGIDAAAREALAAAAILARPDEGVVLLCLGHGDEDFGSLGADRVEILDGHDRHSARARASQLHARLMQLQPRHVLIPDRGADAEVGRHLAVLTLAEGRDVAVRVAEIHRSEARMRATGGSDIVMPLPWLLLLARGVADTRLSFLGQGKVVPLPQERKNGSLTGSVGETPNSPSLAPGNVAAQQSGSLEWLGDVEADSADVPLEEADFILAAGHGVKDVPLFETLAQALGAAVGASRVAVDEGHFPRSRQVGATGRTVTARGYLAIGISGAVQHLQGMQSCRHVMAVNTDAAAPMVQRSELALIGDAQAIMRALLALVQEAKAAPDDPDEGVSS